MAQYLMLKDTPVLKISDHYGCEILDFVRLPHALRYPDVNYDDVMHGWTEVRTMSVGRTNGKKILEALGIKQRNPYTIARACHFASLSDCYWLKEENETVTWEDYQIYCDRNDLDPYEILKTGNKKAYARMQAADYLLNNSDRHEGNWGFYVDSGSGEILRLHPLFDHDQAFSASEVLISQTSEKGETLLEAAISSWKDAGLDLQSLLENLEEIEYLTPDEMQGVLKRVNTLQKYAGI